MMSGECQKEVVISTEVERRVTERYEWRDLMNIVVHTKGDLAMPNYRFSTPMVGWNDSLLIMMSDECRVMSDECRMMNFEFE